jgi:acetylornithine/succinyldiaminopimelate/putrescine aminotransferase
MLGVELKGEAGPLLKGLRERGILATKAGDNVLRLLPPLVIKPAEIRTFLSALEAELQLQLKRGDSPQSAVPSPQGGDREGGR